VTERERETVRDRKW